MSDASNFGSEGRRDELLLDGSFTSPFLHPKLAV